MYEPGPKFYGFNYESYLPKNIIFLTFLYKNNIYLCFDEEYFPVAGEPAISKLYALGGGTIVLACKSISVGNLTPRLNFLSCPETDKLYELGPGLLADFKALSKNDWNFVSSLLDPKDLYFVVIVDGILYFWGEGA